VQTPFHSSWWTRPCGGFEVLRLAIPVIISTGSVSLMNLTDRMFLLGLSKNGNLAMTASMQAGLLFWMFIALPHATVAYTNAFVSQYCGSGHPEKIGAVVWQGIWFSIALIPVYFLCEPLFQAMFRWFGHDAKLAEMERTFMHIMLYGTGAILAGEGFAAFFYGRGKMQVVMYVNVICVLLNIFLAWCMVFGHFGFPARGLAGAATATVISQWARIVLLLGLVLLDNGREDHYHFLKGIRPDFALFGRLLYYGLASGLHVFADIASFTIFLMMISSEAFAGSNLGQLAGNASTVAFTMNSFTFMPILGAGIAVTTMVGNRIGRKQPDLARRATITAFTLAVVYSGVFAFLFVVTPGTLLSVFSMLAPNPDDFEAVRHLTVFLLRFVAAYLFFDAMSVIFASALKGAGDTWFVMIVSNGLVPLVPVLSFLGVYFFGLGLFWCWTIISGWVCLLALIFFYRFRLGKWQNMHVIESDVIGLI